MALQELVKALLIEKKKEEMALAELEKEKKMALTELEKEKKDDINLVEMLAGTIQPLKCQV